MLLHRSNYFFWKWIFPTFNTFFESLCDVSGLRLLRLTQTQLRERLESCVEAWSKIMSLVHGLLTKGDENKDGGCSRKRERRDGRINHGRDVVADKNRKRTGEEHPRCSIFLSFVEFDFHGDSVNALSSGYWRKDDR